MNIDNVHVKRTDRKKTDFFYRKKHKNCQNKSIISLHFYQLLAQIFLYMPKDVYFISGLGADYRAFSKLTLSVNMVHIQWLPSNEEDSIATYAQKLLPQIDTNQPVTLVGLSFGGMVAVELSKLISNCKVILLSSAPTPAAIPKTYKLFSAEKWIDKIPAFVFTKPNFIVYQMFGVRSKEHKALLKLILKETDPIFFKWALKAVLSWKNETLPTDLTQIHGTKDFILPKYGEDIIEIPNGGHLMVLEQAKEISAVLNRLFW